MTVIIDDTSPSFADDVIAALNVPKRGILAYSDTPQSRNAAASFKQRIRHARRFEATNEVVKIAFELSLSPIKTILRFAEASHAPHDKVWIEWDEDYRQQLICEYHKIDKIEDNDVASNIGYLLETERPMGNDGQSWYSATGVFMPKMEPQRRVHVSPISLAIHPDNNDRIFKKERLGNLGSLLPNPLGKDNQKLIDLFAQSSAPDIVKDQDGFWNEDYSKYQGQLNESDWETIASLKHTARTILGHTWVSDQFDHENIDKQEAGKLFDELAFLSGKMMFQTSPHSGINIELYQDAAKHNKNPNVDIWGDAAMSHNGDGRFLVTLLAMINYNWVAGGEPQRSRQKSISFGRTKAHSEYYKLGITVPKEQIEIKDHQIGHSTPRRQHEVRGHFRVIKRNGIVTKRVWVKPHNRGNPELGIITKDYVLLQNHQ